MTIHRPAAEVAVLLVALVLPTAVTWAYFILLAPYPAHCQQAVYTIGKTVQFALPIVWVGVLRRESLGGLLPRRSGMGAGAAFGLAILLAMLGVYHLVLRPSGLLAAAQSAIDAKVAGFGIDSRAKYVVLAGFYSLVHSGLEEYYWRWFVFGRLARLLALPWAAVVSSLGFMAHHVLVLAVYFGLLSAPTLLFSAAVAVGGLAWAWLFHRTQSLGGVWLSHLLVDAGIFLVGYDLITL